MNSKSLFSTLALSAAAAIAGQPAAPAPKVTPSGPAFGDLLVTNKVFVLPEGQAVLRTRFDAAWFPSDPSEVVFIPEITIGLPGRFQLSLSQESVKAKGDRWRNAAVFPEVRWGIAPWGELPLNPTLGLGYEFVAHDKDVVKTSLYLAEEFGGGQWLWAANFTYQKRVGGDKERELIAKTGLHYVIVPNKFTLGAEAKFEHAKTYGVDAGTAKELLVGPAMIWRPMDRLTVRAGSFFGVGLDSPDNESTLSLEWAF